MILLGMTAIATAITIVAVVIDNGLHLRGVAFLIAVVRGAI